MGPLISEAQRETSRFLSGTSGVAEGARAVTGGDVPDGAGFFIAPAVLADVDNTAGASRRRRSSGRSVCMIPFDTEENAIRMANDSPYGLFRARSWTRDPRPGRYRVAKGIRTGNLSVKLGELCAQPRAPFGGFKQSGMGREMGMHAAALYTEVKNVLLQRALSGRSPASRATPAGRRLLARICDIGRSM
jgi:acyl-CoA reductase-like NAD-dependent aldehyde dehydrogenase